VEDAASVGSVEQQLFTRPRNCCRKGKTSNENAALRQTSEHGHRCTRTNLGSPDPTKRQAIPAS
jgi:hypothetical protein